MADTLFTQLVLDALYNRRKVRHGCFASNPAGDELLACPPAALDDIEQVIVSLVVPSLSAGESFQGLTYVLGAYLVIGSTHEPKRTFAFLRQMPNDLLCEALGAASSVFGRPRGEEYIFVAPNTAMLGFLDELARSPCESLASHATKLLQKLAAEGFVSRWNKR